MLQFSDEVRAHVGGLGINSTADSSKQGNSRTTKPEPSNHFHRQVNIANHASVNEGKGQESEDGKADKPETHDGSGLKGDFECSTDAFAGHDGGPDVADRRDLHSEKSAQA